MKKQRQKTDSELKAEIIRKGVGIPEGGLEAYYKSVNEKRSFFSNNKKRAEEDKIIVPAKTEEKDTGGDGTVKK